jgi:hypothetical protein
VVSREHRTNRSDDTCTSVSQGNGESCYVRSTCLIGYFSEGEERVRSHRSLGCARIASPKYMYCGYGNWALGFEFWGWTRVEVRLMCRCGFRRSLEVDVRLVCEMELNGCR